MNALKKLFNYFRELTRKLLSIHDSPHAIAGGVAIGVFMGFMPLFGVKTLISIGLAWLFRCNAIAAVIAVSLHDIVTPLWPVFLYIEYDIGYWVFDHVYALPPRMSLKHMHLGEMKVLFRFNKETFINFGIPVLIGSTIISTPLAAFSYVCLTWLLGKRQESKRLKDLSDAREASPNTEKTLTEPTLEMPVKQADEPGAQPKL